MKWKKNQRTNMQSLLAVLADHAEQKRRKLRQERMAKGEAVHQKLRQLNLDTERHLKRFFSMIGEPNSNGCTEWTAGVTNHGYGRIGFFRKAEIASRIAYQVEHGVIDASLDVCHSCDNPPCCNPDHLFTGTAQDNLSDAVRKKRIRHGEAHRDAVLTEEMVLLARKMHVRGVVTCREIAIKLGVKEGTIKSAISGRNWRHLS